MGMARNATASLAGFRQSLERDVRKWVAEGSGLAGERVIPGDSAGPSPEGMYCSVLDIGEEAEGKGSYRHAWYGGETHELAGVVRSARYRLEGYRSAGGDVMDVAHRFAAWAWSGPGMVASARLRFRCVEVSGIEEADAVKGGEWERRARLEIVVDYWMVTRAATGVIERVGIGYNRASGDGYDEVRSNGA